MIADLRDLNITLAAELSKTGMQMSDSAAFAEAKQPKTTIHDNRKASRHSKPGQRHSISGETYVVVNSKSIAFASGDWHKKYGKKDQ